MRSRITYAATHEMPDGSGARWATVASCNVVCRDAASCGRIAFQLAGNGPCARTVLDLRNLPPGLHGIRVSEYGDMSDPPRSLGPRFLWRPAGSRTEDSEAGGRAAPSDVESADSHLVAAADDLAVIYVGADGTASGSFVVGELSPCSLVGRSVALYRILDSGLADRDPRQEWDDESPLGFAWGVIGFSGD
ncbi:hypothetical protein DFJ74DRAFT_475914 [Hyaloraphidium curvatum]|nr:hypothetical protein DFJ74DRAFT_475914 [Hyaloraphidium curvatum]